MKKYCAGTCALFVLFAAQFLLPAAIAAEVGAGSTVLSARTPDGLAIEVRIATSAPAANFPFRTKYIWGGGDVEPPSRVIESIDVVVAGEAVFVPLSAFADLGSPKRASISVSDGGFQLLIIGGDAGGSYDAMLAFDGPWLIRRRVSSRTFPDEAWEETSYSFNRN